MSKKYIHLLHKIKFLDNLRSLFTENKDHVVVIIKDENNRVLSSGEQLTDTQFDELLFSSKAVFAHFLNYSKAQIINKVESKVPIVWFMWGGDAYYLGKFDNKFLLPKTKKLRIRLGFRSVKGLKDLAKMMLGKYSDLINPNKEVLKAIGNVDIVVPVIPQDYYNLKSKYKTDASVFHCNYVNQVLLKQPDPQHSSKSVNILLGNSANFSNNHLEAIDMLASKSLGNSKVIVPLSYGKQNYGEYISDYARKKLEGRVEVIDTFLPINEYNRIFESCDTVIMNHCRQCALGNVIIALWNRKTLYLNSRSDLYDFLISNGFSVFDTNDFDPEMKLSVEQRKQNQNQLSKVFAPEIQRRRFQQLLDRVST